MRVREQEQDRDRTKGRKSRMNMNGANMEGGKEGEEKGQKEVCEE